jgi:hypothetical protein
VDDYIVVTQDNLTEAADVTGWDRRFIKGELQDAEYRNCELIIFEDAGDWHRIFVNRHYDVSWVMEQLESRWGHRGYQ